VCVCVCVCDDVLVLVYVSAGSRQAAVSNEWVLRCMSGCACACEDMCTQVLILVRLCVIFAWLFVCMLLYLSEF
jgi:hypothetical protein